MQKTEYRIQHLLLRIGLKYYSKYPIVQIVSQTEKAETRLLRASACYFFAHLRNTQSKDSVYRRLNAGFSKDFPLLPVHVQSLQTTL
jgi:hypothetical protein